MTAWGVVQPTNAIWVVLKPMPIPIVPCLASFALGALAWGLSQHLAIGLVPMEDLQTYLQSIELPRSLLVATGAIGLGVIAIAAVMLWDEDDSKSKGKPASKAMGTDRAAELNKLTTSLDTQIRDLLSFIVEQLNEGNQRSASMARTESELASIGSIEQLRALVELLMREHKSTQVSTQRFLNRCKLAQAKISTLRLQLDKAERLATTDALTGIANRRGLLDLLEQAVARAHASSAPMCLVMTDIDHFKKINDTFGHPVGDGVLSQFAETIRKHVRSSDIVGRYGGEEFALVLPGATSGDAIDIVKRLQQTIRNTQFESGGTKVRDVTASFGIAAIEEDESSVRLLERADRMLYEAKRSGRDCYALASAADTTSP